MKKRILLVLTLCLSVLLSAVSYSVNFSIADLELSQEDRGYDIIRTDETLITTERSKPELPVKFVNLIIPCGMEVDDINITTQQQNVNGDFTVNPSPGPMVITDPPSPAEPDSNIYNSSEIYPNQPVEVLSHGYFDGANRIVSLAIYPVQYIPNENTLIFNNNIDFSLSFTSSESPVAIPQYRLSKYDALYNNALRSIVENDIDVDTYKFNPEIIEQHREGDFDMIIIGEDEYASDFSDFITWKEKKGMRVLYISYDTASFDTNFPNGDNWGNHPINDKAGKIRTCLKEYYEYHGTVYALIVGGTTDFDQTPQPNDEILPVRYGCRHVDYDNQAWIDPNVLGWAPDNNFYRIPADLYFSDFDGDYDVEGNPNGYYGETNDDIQSEPEIFVGRIIISEQEDADNHEQIHKWIDKLITYETNPGYGDFDYLDKTVLFDGFWGVTGSGTIYDGVFDYLLNSHFSFYEEVNPTHNPQFPTGAYVIDKMNEGFGLSHFYWHGDKTKIDNKAGSGGNYLVCGLNYHDDFYTSEPSNGFDNLLENGKYSVSYMISCQTGSYDKSNNTNGFNHWGDRISMAEAYTSYLDKVGGPAMVANTNNGYGGGSQTIEKNFLISIFEDNCFNIGVALGNAKSLSQAHVLILDTSLFGDPEMEVWTDIPEYLEVQHNYATNTITVTCNGLPVENANVYFSTENCSETVFVQTDTNGMALCDFDYQEICATKHNYIPYLKRIIRNSETWTGTTDLKWDVIIPSGSTLNINGTVNLFSFGGKNAQIIVKNGATLNANENSIINGYAGTFVPYMNSAIQIEIPGNKIEVYGNLSVNNASFTSIDDNYWDGVFLNDCGTVTMENPIFTNCELHSEDTSVTINNGSFTNSRIEHYRNDLTLNLINLTDSFIYADATNAFFQEYEVIIEDCTINNYANGTAIYISSYTDYNITGNTIHCDGKAIYINESGTGRNHRISNNDINGNSNGQGLMLYHSYADITGSNKITNKYIGILGMKYCSINLTGSNLSHYQEIHHNTFDELVFMHDSFPHRLYYNKIYDENHENFLLKCIGHEGAREHNVRNNYWGTELIPELDLSPEDGFIYNPQWVPRESDEVTVDLLFSQAKDFEEEENYEQARPLYKQIISDYPESELTPASAKQLLSLETKSNKNYTELKSYYETEPNLNYDEELQNLSEELSNYCDIRLESYETVIGYFEAIIDNPDSIQDSVFAVIDAGYTYLLMEDAGRSSYVGKNANLKPKSREDFESNREVLLSELFANGDENSTQNEIPKVATLHNNYPNPFNPTTTISFSIPNDSKVKLSVYNIKGQKVKTLTNEKFVRGNHSVIWNGVDESGKSVSSGVYFYKLDVNDKSASVKKCLMLK